MIRDHWLIESNHWIRDVAWREDHQHAYNGTAAHTMAILRNLALAILRLTGHGQITRTLQHIAADRTRILPLLTAYPLPTREPHWVWWRLHSVRRWSGGTTEQVLD